MEPLLTLMLIDYWKANETAIATAEFIRTWWLPESTRASLAEVKAALKWLEEREVIARVETRSIAHLHYGRNPSKSREDLERIAEELRRAELN